MDNFIKTKNTQIDNLKKDAELLIKKLETEQFEVAVIGLEKAGKSTFINALIQDELMPEAEKRCTYTSIQVTYSSENENSAEIEFYNDKEFNEKFRELLKQ